MTLAPSQNGLTELCFHITCSDLSLLQVMTSWNLPLICAIKWEQGMDNAIDAHVKLCVRKLTENLALENTLSPWRDWCAFSFLQGCASPCVSLFVLAARRLRAKVPLDHNFYPFPSHMHVFLCLWYKFMSSLQMIFCLNMKSQLSPWGKERNYWQHLAHNPPLCCG